MFFSVDSVAVENVGLFNPFVTSLGTEAEMCDNAATISNSICRTWKSQPSSVGRPRKEEGEKHTSTGLFGHSDGKVMLVIGCNGLGHVDVLAHHASKLNAHALQLKVPRAKAILAQVIVLNILKQAIMLLGGDLPLLPAGSKRVVLCLYDGRAVENVVGVAFNGQPSVFLVIWGIPLAHFEVVGPLPGRELRRAPIQLAARSGSGIRFIQLG